MPANLVIIDDEIDLCFIMKTFFRQKKWNVFVAHTLHEGLPLIKEISPDILILDNNLQDGSGWDQVGKIVEIIPQGKIFLISAHREPASFSTTNKNIIVWEKPISRQQIESVYTLYSQDLQ